MSEHKGATDKTHKVELESEIVAAGWGARSASAGHPVPFEVRLRFVGNGAQATLEFKAGGKKVGSEEAIAVSGKLLGVFEVPANAKGDLTYEVQLKKHKLKEKSEPIPIMPGFTVENPKWSLKEARRGDMLTLTADVDGLDEGAHVPIAIYEHDDDGGHDLVTQIEGEVRGNQLQAKWEYEYHEDTDEIPTAEESEKGYKAPQYFFRVDPDGVAVDSGLLGFRDWVDIALTLGGDRPAAGEEYVLTLPDGKERKGKLDDQGKSREKDVPPGNFKVRFPRYQDGAKA